ncbi:MAG: hypothetical protein KJO17_11255 [Acidimicrobiia bacterium]|nr:hypothetical protein [Acidimicrobiia bacterium]NNL69643.1 hypothetical protein [Acidimicrobiia bacterium]
MFFLLGSFVPLVILGAIVFVIVKAVTNRSERRTVESAPLAIKRVLLFGSLYAALHVAAWGVAGLLALINDTGIARGERAAEPLAMAIVAVPIVFLLGRWVWRGLAEASQRDAAFSLYVSATAVTALIVLIVSTISVGDWLFSDGSFSAPSVASLAVWAPIWAVHWWLWKRYEREVSNVHVFAGSAVSLVGLAAYGGLLFDSALRGLFDSFTDVTVTTARSDEVSSWLVGLVVMGVVYVGHWLLTGLREKRDLLWHSYVVLAGVLGGLIVAVTGAGILAYGVLEWLFGDPDFSSAVEHFEQFLPAVTTLVVGLVVWLYHRAVLGPAAGPRTEVQRVYDYVVAAVGLVTTIVGVTILLVGFQEALFPPRDSMASEVNALLGALTALAVGLPLWGQAWRRISSHLESDPTEISSPTRRSFLFGLVGIGGAVTAVSLLIMLVVVFDATLGDGGDLLREDIQIPLALVLAVGSVVVYHFLVLREDQESEPERPAEPKKLVLVTADDAFARAVEELTGARVRVLHRLDSNGEAADAAAVASAVAASEHDDLLVVPGPAGSVQVIPYRR